MNLAVSCVEWMFRPGANRVWRVCARVRCIAPEIAARASRVWEGCSAYFESRAALEQASALGVPEEGVVALQRALAARPGSGRVTTAAHVLEANRYMAEFARVVKETGCRVTGASALLATRR